MRPESPAEKAVWQQLRSRADRGIFRSFAVTRVRGKLAFSFTWLRERPFRLVFDNHRDRLEFRSLLPNMPAREPLYKDFRAFLKGRSDATLAEHRRFSPDRLRISCRNRQASVSVFVDCLDGDWEHAVSKALKLVNEIFLGFLRGPYHEYMVANHEEPED